MSSFNKVGCIAPTQFRAGVVREEQWRANLRVILMCNSPAENQSQ
jgi:hypothetical protein